MALYIEVLCDAAKKTTVFGEGCASDIGDGPDGSTVLRARQNAKAQGWIRKDGKDVCPYCQKH